MYTAPAASAPASRASTAEPVKKAVAEAKPATVASAPATVATDSARAKALLEGKDTAKAAPAPKPEAAREGGRFVVQVGAFADAAAAREMRGRVEKLGLKSYMQVVETSTGSRTRVRAGPFESRDEAEKALAKAKKGIRIINCARGGLVVEADLAEAIKSGKVAGAGFDVFEVEPAEASPLFGLPNVVCTPHLGASTTEAQENVAIGVPGSALNLGAAFAVVFVVALIAWAIAARLIRLLLHATPLSLPDRGLGAVFGLLRGVVLLLAVAAVVGLTPAVKSSAWQHSRGAGMLSALLDGLLPLLPPQIASQLRRA